MTLRSKFNSYLAKTSPFPLGFEVHRAMGSYLFDEHDRSYLDFISGIGVSNLGHQHPEILSAIHTQADKYLHTMVYGEHIQSPQILLAEKLLAHLHDSFEQVYFTSSGAESVDLALKLVKKHTGKDKIIACKNAYHGSTIGAASLMSDPGKTKPFGDLLSHIYHIEFNNIDSLGIIDEHTGAVVMEIIQAEAGVILPDPDFILALKQKCIEYNVLIVLDEIQSGMGRSGTLFAFSQFDIIPDILLLGKSLGGGLPLSACIASKELMYTLADHPPLIHMSTFGGHPLSCAAGLASLEVLTTSNLIEESKLKSKIFQAKLNHPSIATVRSTQGLWMAIELGNQDTVSKLVSICMENGLLVDWFLFNDTSIRIAPPLTISESELQEAADIIHKSLDIFAINNTIIIP